MMPSYSTYDPKGWGGDPKRGAAMGRRKVLDVDEETWSGKLYLRKVRMSADGAYDNLGTYWGLGNPLYWAADDSGQVDFVVRALNREEAKIAVRHLLPNAQFFK